MRKYLITTLPAFLDDLTLWLIRREVEVPHFYPLLSFEREAVLVTFLIDVQTRERRWP